MKHADERLRAAGLRVTRPRLAILAEVSVHPHADVESIATGARARTGSLSTQAIYDVVHALTHVGVLRCIEPAGSPARFELALGDNHYHHLVCRACDEIVDVPCATGKAPCQRGQRGRRLFDRRSRSDVGVCAPAVENPSRHNGPQQTIASTTHRVEENRDEHNYKRLS